MNSARPWIFVVSVVVALIGYLGPWVSHSVAGLVITGIDLPEYVKFLPAIRSGSLAVWREGFYLPPFAVSLTLALFGFRSALGLPDWLKWASPAVAFVSAALLLPPAWTPGLLLTPEFRLQATAMVFCWGVTALSPIAARLPLLPAKVIAALLIAATLIVPVMLFTSVLPEIRGLYAAPLRVGWGLYVMEAGLLGLLWSIWAVPAVRTAGRVEENDG